MLGQGSDPVTVQIIHIPDEFFCVCFSGSVSLYYPSVRACVCVCVSESAVTSCLHSAVFRSKDTVA